MAVLEALRIVAVLMAPITPALSLKIYSQLGFSEADYAELSWGDSSWGGTFSCSKACLVLIGFFGTCVRGTHVLPASLFWIGSLLCVLQWLGIWGLKEGIGE